MYDVEGNRVSKSNATNRELYTWDHRNRLTSVTQQEWDSVEQDWTTTQIVEYAYDYNNVWIRKTIGNNKTIFIPENYQTTVQIDNNATTHHYLWTPNQQDKLLADTTPNSISWALTDHLGTIRDVLGATTTHLIYDAFGNLTSGTNPLLFGYTGKAFDSATNLQNNINRWYDATTGRWLSIDPIGFEGNDTNLYSYISNLPILLVDFNGLMSASNLISQRLISTTTGNHSVSLYYTNVFAEKRHSCIQLDWSEYNTYQNIYKYDNGCVREIIFRIEIKRTISYELINLSSNSNQPNKVILSRGGFSVLPLWRESILPGGRPSMWAIVRNSGGCAGQKDPLAIYSNLNDYDFFLRVFYAAEYVGQHSNNRFYQFPLYTCNSVTAEIIRQAGGYFMGSPADYPGSQNNFTH